MMRILYVSTLYDPNIIGGAERVVQYVAEGLTLMGHDCIVVTLGRSAKAEARNINGVKVHILPIRNLYWPFQSSRPSSYQRALWHAMDSYNPVMSGALSDILDEERPDVVNTHNIAGFSVASWKEIKRRKLPLVHTLHDQYLLCPNTTMFKNGENCVIQCGKCRLYSIPRRRLSREPDIVIGVSRFILELHRQYGYFSGVKEKVVYNAYERPEQSLEFESPSIKDRPIRFGFLGRLHQSKGIELLINAFITLPIGMAELWIGGRCDKDYEARLKCLTAGRNDIRWLGFVLTESLLADVDVIVIPSIWNDTAPLAALEALAWGLPIVASRRGGLPELVTERTGWLFEPDDPSSLRRIFESCIEKKQELTDKKIASLNSAQQFSKRNMFKNYLDAYGEAERLTLG